MEQNMANGGTPWDEALRRRTTFAHMRWIALVFYQIQVTTCNRTWSDKHLKLLVTLVTECCRHLGEYGTWRQTRSSWRRVALHHISLHGRARTDFGREKIKESWIMCDKMFRAVSKRKGLLVTGTGHLNIDPQFDRHGLLISTASPSTSVAVKVPVHMPHITLRTFTGDIESLPGGTTWLEVTRRHTHLIKCLRKLSVDPIGWKPGKRAATVKRVRFCFASYMDNIARLARVPDAQPYIMVAQKQTMVAEARETLEHALVHVPPSLSESEAKVRAVCLRKVLDLIERASHDA